VDNFGKLSYGISFVGLFSTIPTLGLTAILVRNIVNEEKATSEILGTAFLLRLVASLFTITLIAFSIWQVDERFDIRSITVALSLTLIFTPFDTIEIWFQSQVMNGVLAIFKSFQLILISLVKIAFITFHLSLMAFVWLFVVEQLIKIIGMLWLYQNHHQSILQWKVNWARGMDMLRDSWPLIFSGAMVMLYMRIDQVMLGNMASVEAAGNYAAAVRFSECWYFIPLVICDTVFPAILRSRQRSTEEYRYRLQLLYDIMAWISIGVAIPMTIFSVPLIVALLGQEYLEAGKILAWHIWAGPFVFLGIAQSKWLMAENLARFNFFQTSLGAIVNVMLNCLLIPRYQGIGAAIATVISYSISTHISCLFFRPLFSGGWMLTKALFIPFRLRQNLFYFEQLKNLLGQSALL
jgi:O-antigen/teichoic acid export membrane protein